MRRAIRGKLKSQRAWYNILACGVPPPATSAVHDMPGGQSGAFVGGGQSGVFSESAQRARIMAAKWIDPTHRKKYQVSYI